MTTTEYIAKCRANTRALQRRNRRMAFVAAAAFIGLAFTATYTVNESNLHEQELYKVQSELRVAESKNVALDGAVRTEYAGEFFCTAYCTEKYEHICGEGHDITASGLPVQNGVSVAADPNVFPFGTVLYIEGVGIRIVQDIGGMVEGDTLDIAVGTHEEALGWSGYGNHQVFVISVGAEG